MHRRSGKNIITMYSRPSQYREFNPIENLRAVKKIRIREKLIFDLKEIPRYSQEIWRFFRETTPKARCEVVMDNRRD